MLACFFVMSQSVALESPTNVPVATALLYNNGHGPSRGFVMVPGLGQDNYRYMLGVELTGNSRSESPPREA